jgi:hypothetical protein
MELASGAIGAAAAAIGVPIVFALLGKAKWLRHTPAAGKDFGRLMSEYARWERWAPLPFFFFVAVIGLVLWKSFMLLAGLQAARLGPSEFLVYEPSLALALPSMFLAILLSAVPMHFLYLRMLGAERYAEYIEYGNQRFGIDTWKLLRYMAYVAVPLCVISAFLLLDSYVRVTESKIGVNSFFGVGEKEYAYDEVAHLRLVKSFKAPKGNIVRKPYFVIGFSDGAEYSFKRTQHETGLQEQKEIVHFISGRTKKDVQIDDPYPQ